MRIMMRNGYVVNFDRANIFTFLHDKKPSVMRVFFSDKESKEIRVKDRISFHPELYTDIECSKDEFKGICFALDVKYARNLKYRVKHEPA